MSLSSELDWLLNDLVGRVVHIEKAAVLSRDGLTMGASSGLTKEDADHLSAVAAGFQSLARGAGRHFGGGHARQIMVDMKYKFLLHDHRAGRRQLPGGTSATSSPDVGSSPTRWRFLVERVGGQSVRRAAAGQLGLRDDVTWPRLDLDDRLDRDAAAGLRPYALAGGPGPAPAARPSMS